MTTRTVFQSARSMMVKDLRPGLTECGKIKIGNKGREIRSKSGNVFQPPEKLDHFLITTLERGKDGNFLIDQGMHARFGDNPKELPVRLLFNDPWLNFQTTYAAMRGGTRFCTGDGERAERVDEQGEIHEVECTCERLNPLYSAKDKCKINGTLSVMIEDAAVVGGIWKLRTTSINTCQGIASSLQLLSMITEGHIAGVPLMLTVRPKAAVTPQGATTTVYVVGLEFRGTINELRELAHDKALRDATFGHRMERVEEQARAMLSAPRPISDDETTDLVDEFYPEEGARARGLQMAPRPEDGPARPKPRTLDQLVDQHTTAGQQEAQGEPTAEQGTETPADTGSAPSEQQTPSGDDSTADPGTSDNRDPLSIAGLKGLAALDVLRVGLEQAPTAAGADALLVTYADRIKALPPKQLAELQKIVTDKIEAEAAALRGGA